MIKWSVKIIHNRYIYVAQNKRNKMDIKFEDFFFN